ncbi:chloride channel CLIC-like protein 1 [Coregonus clupeaformis]|uniref:chloride channel CLIC-like protein 1 n=1 Tax=Coregonus clupeaformis TaxID=59861 RepID=UPI001E1C3037|nr:chloride channel CLIC-like protein 1 [Coregonus clupeaformis]
MKKSTSAIMMHTITVAVCSLVLVAQGQMDDDEWLDPHDMLNYDPSSKTMRKPAQPVELSNYPNVPTKRREYSQDSDQVEVKECNNKVEGLQREIEGYKKKITHIAQQPSCNPVFKRFLTKLLKEIEKVGLPTDLKNDIHYDAKVRLSRQAVAEIRKLLEGMDSCRMGALDDALSQILVDLKPHDFEAWRWHFEDTFGVEIDTVMKVFMYCSCQAAIRPGITRLLRIGRPRDPPPPAVDQPEPKAHLRGTNHDPQAGGDAPQCSPPRYVETLRNDDRLFSNVQEEIQQEPVVAGATTEGNDSQEAKPSPAKAKPNERDVTSESKVATDWEAEQLAKRQPSTTTQGNNTLEKSSEEKMVHGETDRVPVQETEPTSLAL